MQNVKNIHGIIFTYISMKILMIILLTFIALLNGCVSIKNHAAGLEPSARPFTASKYRVLSDAEVVESSFKLFWLVPVTPEPRINEAIDNLIIKSGGDNIIEMKTWHERQYWLLGTVDIIHVNGKIVRYMD